MLFRISQSDIEGRNYILFTNFNHLSKIRKKYPFSPNSPWRTSSAQGNILKISQGGNGICKKNPSLNLRVFTMGA